MDKLDDIKDYYNAVYYRDAVKQIKVSRHLRSLARRAKIRAGENVLDVACGKGEWLVAAAERGASTAGVDLSEVAVEVCKANLPDGEFHAGAAERLPFEDNRFDVVTCLGSLEHFVEPERALREMIRVSKVEARFIILVPIDGFFLRRWGLYGGTRQTAAREVVRSLGDWEKLFRASGLHIQRRWKDLHVLSWSWINKGSVPGRFVRAAVALLLPAVPLHWQYQVYFDCRKG